MFFKHGELKNSKYFYTYSTFMTMFAGAGIYCQVFLIDRGFTLAEIAVAFLLADAARFILMVPCGAFADTFGRKFTFILGLALYAGFLVSVPHLDTVHLLYGVWLASAIPGTLMGAAEDAWAVDWLRSQGREDLVGEFYVKRQSICNFGLIIAAWLSSRIVTLYGMDVLWYAAGLAAACAIIIILMQKEIHVRAASGLIGTMKQSVRNMKEGTAFALKNRNIVYLVAGISFLLIGGELAFMWYRPFLKQMGVPEEHLGDVSMLSAALCIAAPFFARRMLAYAGHEKVYLAYYTVVLAFLLGAAGLLPSPGGGGTEAGTFGFATIAAVALFAVSDTRYSSMSPVTEPFFQRLVPSRLRATVGGFKNMALTMAVLVSRLLVWLLTDALGMQYTIAVSAVFVIPAIYFFLKIRVEEPAGK
jgi:MFS family permease